MSIKFEVGLETFEDVGNGCESGECSEEEIQVSSRVRNQKKHRKRKRKHRSSRSHSGSSYDYSIPNFNPYEVMDVDSYRCEAEFEAKLEEEVVEEAVEEEVEEDIAAVDLVECPTESVVAAETALVAPTNFRGAVEDDRVAEPGNIVYRKNLTRIDFTGIDIELDCSKLLLKKGFSADAVSRLVAVLNKEAEEDESGEDEDEEDEGQRQQQQNEREQEEEEEALMRELPVIVDTSDDRDRTETYSPEPTAQRMVQPYSHRKRSSVTYASSTSAASSVREILDSLPGVTAEDPRVVVGGPKTAAKLPMPVVAPVESEAPLAPAPCSSSSPREWEVNVAAVVKAFLKPYLQHGDITRDEYKSILRRAVYKIVGSGDRKLEPDKISGFVHSYVTMTQKTRA